MTSNIMALTQKEAEKISKQLREAFQDLKIEIKSNEVFASAKSLTLSHVELLTLAFITQGYTLVFGRTGPNFRMIIS